MYTLLETNIISRRLPYILYEEEQERREERKQEEAAVRSGVQRSSISHRSPIVDAVSRSTTRSAITISASDGCGRSLNFERDSVTKRKETKVPIRSRASERERERGKLKGGEESERSCQPPSQYGSLLRQAASFPIICHSLT